MYKQKTLCLFDPRAQFRVTSHQIRIASGELRLRVNLLTCLAKLTLDAESP